MGENSNEKELSEKEEPITPDKENVQDESASDGESSQAADPGSVMNNRTAGDKTAESPGDQSNGDGKPEDSPEPLQTATSKGGDDTDSVSSGKQEMTDQGEDKPSGKAESTAHGNTGDETPEDKATTSGPNVNAGPSDEKKEDHPVEPVEEPASGGAVISDEEKEADPGKDSAEVSGTEIKAIDEVKSDEGTGDAKEEEDRESGSTDEAPTPATEAKAAVTGEGKQAAGEAENDKPEDDPVAGDTAADEKKNDETVVQEASGDAEAENSVENEEQDDGDDEEAEEEEEEEEEKDYSTLSKEALIGELEEILQGENIKFIERKVRMLKPFYDDQYESERKNTLNKFLDEGGAEVDFQYAGDALDRRYEALYDRYKERRNQFYAGQEKIKDENLRKKHDVIEKLRDLVEGEETTTSISALKEIQKEWKTIGPVPGQYARSLWASYNALIDRFYDNRSIYFELKELDRKKNLEAKIELCEKAEHLSEYDNIRDAVKELNDLHNEFKHIGPIPKEVQEDIWQRFKSASDAIYARRKEYVNVLKKDLHGNLEEKRGLVEELKEYLTFDSDKISEWNEKTRAILDIQKKWEKVGGLPREHAKEVNKAFWTGFKTFFGNKNKFFKKLEGQRDENLKKKEELIAGAEAVRDSEDWENTANTLKELQKEWKNIGPVPEKLKNDVYKRFKAACDHFFDRRRAHSKDVEEDFRDNLKRKEEICDRIEKLAAEDSPDIDGFKDLQVSFDSIGFVPRNAIRKIQKRYDEVVEKFLSAAELPDAEKSELKFTAEINRLKSSPNSDRRIHRKESELRRMIGKLENDIALWKNNLEFFAESKTADKLREEFNQKIQDATDQLDGLKEELKVLNKI